MKLQKLYSYVRQAVQKYNMLEENDKIAIGISGGKDSLTLLYALAGLRRFYPCHFELVAINVDFGYENFDVAPVAKLCNELDVPFYHVETEIGKILDSHEPEHGSYCSLCARLRKGALNNKALELDCNKVAYAHHMDDMIETLFLSLFYEGRLCSFWPVTPLDGTGITVIRPLMLVSESEVIGFKNKYNLPVVKNPCKYDGKTKRQYVKELVHSISLDNPGVKKRIMNAIVGTFPA